MKNIRIFYFENFHFLVVNFSVYLNRRVFVMNTVLVHICQSLHISTVPTNTEGRNNVISTSARHQNNVVSTSV